MLFVQVGLPIFLPPPSLVLLSFFYLSSHFLLSCSSSPSCLFSSLYTSLHLLSIFHLPSIPPRSFLLDITHSSSLSPARPLLHYQPVLGYTWYFTNHMKLITQPRPATMMTSNRLDAATPLFHPSSPTYSHPPFHPQHPRRQQQTSPVQYHGKTSTVQPPPKSALKTQLGQPAFHPNSPPVHPAPSTQCQKHLPARQVYKAHWLVIPPQQGGARFRATHILHPGNAVVRLPARRPLLDHREVVSSIRRMGRSAFVPKTEDEKSRTRLFVGVP